MPLHSSLVDRERFHQKKKEENKFNWLIILQALQEAQWLLLLGRSLETSSLGRKQRESRYLPCQEQEKDEGAGATHF